MYEYGGDAARRRCITPREKTRARFIRRGREQKVWQKLHARTNASPVSFSSDCLQPEKIGLLLIVLSGADLINGMIEEAFIKKLLYD